MNWYKKAQITDRELGNRYVPDEEEYLYMTGRDEEYVDLVDKKMNEEYEKQRSDENNLLHHKRMLLIRPIEEEIRVLQEKIRNLPDFGQEQYNSRKLFEKMIRNLERKAITIINKKM